MPTIDWQSAAVLAIVGVSAWHVARQVWRLVRPRPGQAGCATGCGSCPSKGTSPASSAASPSNVGRALPLVELEVPRRPR